MASENGPQALLPSPYTANDTELQLPPDGGGEAPSGQRAGPSATSAFSFDDLKILHINIRGFLSHHSELFAYLSLLPSLPSLLSLNETWLDKSVGSITVPGYTLVSRLDRRDGRKAGGIAFFRT